MKNYKDFIPWCTDSWQTNSAILPNPNFHVFNKYNISNNILLKDTYSFNGGIKVGFNIMDFSYVSNITCIEPNIVLSEANSSSSNVFKKLESIWILKEIPAIEDNDYNELSVEYYIEFEFQSMIFSNAASLFLDFLGKNIVSSFINKCNNECYSQGINEEILDFDEYIKYNLNKIKFESENDKNSIEYLLKILLIEKYFCIKDMKSIIYNIRHNILFLKRMIFYSDILITNNNIQITKIVSEIKNCLNLNRL